LGSDIQKSLTGALLPENLSFERVASKLGPSAPTVSPARSAKMRTFVAAENRLLRETLSRLLARRDDLEVVGQGSSLHEMISSISELQPELLLLNHSGSQLEDLHFIRKLRAQHAGLRIVVMGMRAVSEDFLQFVRAGVAGYMLSDASTGEVLDAVGLVRDGGAACPPQLCLSLFRYFEGEMAAFPSASVREQVGLTRKEQQIIHLVARGMTNKEIAREFSLSEQTVKNHIYRMNQKIGTEDRLDIVRYCRAKGLSV
jgi:DNA-binding NarL/FixJ family response regulator